MWDHHRYIYYAYSCCVVLTVKSYSEQATITRFCFTQISEFTIILAAISKQETIATLALLEPDR